MNNFHYKLIKKIKFIKFKNIERNLINTFKLDFLKFFRIYKNFTY